MEQENQRQKSFVRRFWPQNMSIRTKWIAIIILILIMALTISIINSNLHKIPNGPEISDGPTIKTNTLDTVPIIDNSNNSVNSSQDRESLNDTEEKIIISLPYSADQPTNSIVPMGETIYHPDPPNPGGHPGIDFQWSLIKPIDIIACADGEVASAEKTPSHNKYDVSINTRGYTIVYAELENIDDAIKKGAKVTLGQIIGEPGKFNGNHYNIHWELKHGTNRICPMSYFDTDSKKRIEAAWASTNSLKMKANSPDICSNFYKDKK